MRNVRIIKILDAEALSVSTGLTSTKYTEMQDIGHHDFSKDIGIVVVNSGTSTDLDCYYEIGVPTLGGNVAIGSDTRVGAGLDDITVAGTFNALALPSLWTPMQRRYRVQVDGTGATDTFKWSRNDGKTWTASTVNMATTAQELEDGITVLWTAKTGHTLNNHWDFDVTNLIWLNSTKNIDAMSTAGSQKYDAETLKPTKYIRFKIDNQDGANTATVSLYLMLQIGG